MAFNQREKRLVVRNKDGNYKPCVMCGKTYPLPDAVHIIDEKEWKNVIGHDSKINGIPLCPNCHRVFDDVLKPYIYKSFEKFGVINMPKGWSKNNKVSEVSGIDLEIGNNIEQKGKEKK